MSIDNLIVHGPDLRGSIPEKSLGIQIYEALLGRRPGEIAFVSTLKFGILKTDRKVNYFVNEVFSS